MSTLARLQGFDGGRPIPSEGGQVNVILASLTPGVEGNGAELTLINSGEDDLVISKIEIESPDEGVFRLAENTEAMEAPSYPIRIAPTDSGESNTEASLMLRVKRAQDDQLVPTGTIRIHSNSVSLQGRTQAVIEYEIIVQRAAPLMQVVPSAVNFGLVEVSRSVQNELSLLNVGGGPLTVWGFKLQGHSNFRLNIDGVIYPPGNEDVFFDEPLEIDAGTASDIATYVLYTAQDDTEAEGMITFYSNDPNSPDGLLVPISANAGGPCLDIVPRDVQFGGKVVGDDAVHLVTVVSCGDVPVEIKELAFTADSGQEFSLDLSSLPGVPQGTTEITDSGRPVTLAPNEQATFRVIYRPEDLSPRDGNGQFIFDRGTIRFLTNMFSPEAFVEVTGVGVDEPCPQAIIDIAEGDEVIPQTILHLDGTLSLPVEADIVEYFWEVSQPGEATSFLDPSDRDPTPSLEANVVGKYLFRLTVKDANGVESCVPAIREVMVVPDEAIHVELVWSTPADEFPERNEGTDLDLHFVHPNADSGYDGDGDGKQDGWFAPIYDCFWDNRRPDWGEPGNRNYDNPSLDRDDTDGLGPENLNLSTPENDIRYKVGVHYWDDNGLGESLATLRVYIYGVPAYVDADVPLREKDMWWVTEVPWPPGEIMTPIKVCEGTNDLCSEDSECGGAPCVRKIVGDYVHPMFSSF